MNTFVKYIQNFFALFLLLMVVRQLIPNGRLKKYICFFTELVLVIGIMQPFFSLFDADDTLLEKIRYETFTEHLNEASRDIGRMEFLQNDYYRTEYENAAALDVEQTAEGVIEPYGLSVKKAAVKLTESYEVEEIFITVGEKKEIDSPDGIFVEQGKAQGSQMVLEKLREKLVRYYGTKEEQVKISYGG